MLRLILPLLGSEAGVAIRQITRKTALLSAIAFFVLTGVIFLLATIYLALARAFGDIHAALFVALGCFALAFIGFIAIKILDARRRRRQVREHTRVDGSAVLTATALAVLPELMKRPLIAAAMPIIGLAAYAFLFNGEGTPKNRRRQE